MPSAFLNQALDGTDVGYNKAIVDAQMVVAQGGDRRTLVYDSPTGSLSYVGVARASFPRTYLNTDTMPVCTGVVRNVTTDGQMATALTATIANAALGLHDWIVVALGTYINGYAPGVKQGDAAPGGNGVGVIISKAVYDSIDPMTGIAVVCPAKKTVTAADVTTQMPYFKNVSLANAEQWAFDGSTKGWRFIGIRFGVDATVGALGRLVRVGNGDGAVQNGPTNSPQNVGFDRCGFDGHATLNLKSALELHGRSVYCQDSYFGDQIHHDGQDCKAIASWNGPGPVRVVGNRLVASTEVILVGGAYSTPGCAPADWEIRWNRFEKPLTWNPNHPTYAGKDWSCKNLFEAKKLQYALIEGNYLHRVWPEDQAGAAFLIKSESYGDGAVNGYTHDVIVRWNFIEDAGYGINIAGVQNVDNPVAPTRVVSFGNLWVIGAQYFDASTNPFVGTGLLNFCGCIHDTFIRKGTVNAICQPEGGQAGLYFLDCIIDQTSYGIKGSGKAAGTATLNAYAPGWDVRRNVFVAVDPLSYPTNNWSVASAAAVGFIDYAGGNYALSGTTQVIVPPPLPTAPVLTAMQLLIAASDGTSGVKLATQPSVKLLDDVGALYPMSGTVNVTVVLGQATITAGATQTLTNGISTGTQLTLATTTPGNVTLRYTEPTSGLYVEDTIALDAPHISITTPAGDGVSGVALVVQPVVQLRDAANAPIAQAGVTVRVTVPGAEGAVGAGGTAVTDAAGQAAFATLAISRTSSGDVGLRYSAPGFTPVDETVAITVPAVDPVVSQLVCTRLPKAGKSGEPLRIEPRYEWQDANGVVVPSAATPVHIEAVGNVSDFGTDTLPAIGGVVDFAGSGFGVIGRGKVTIVATDGVL
jgi:hypothetical protein